MSKPKIGLFVTCLVDAMRPQIGWATLKLLEQAGCEVEVPRAQTCCGQPAGNSGDKRGAAALAQQVIETFEGYDYLVGPSGSCVGQIRSYPTLFSDPGWRKRAEDLAAKSFEILGFLHDVMSWQPEGVGLNASVTYHDSCSGLRELGIEAQPRALLEAVEGLEMRPLNGANVCCGFGGTFCVKYPEISTAIISEKTANIAATGADILLAGDLGCLMNMAGRLHREGAATRCFHTAEVLAGMADGPAIGEDA
ncbi:MAG TPA: (Fe-S)-binding protein [Paracoccus sp. (in: a-proteobacteria)]|uniref:(Fe-S)-binding protein n=1 Tax=uncultured Paracoccus sp. TaxID=189685 RepID=UPI002626B5E7|nr:(Fe-S)-binding protein [uncultured Paracoccus sp.]HMQ40290.1 (Fe-S)-binding protein [Paracoccus sp. (in: a-proteobacteria)]HMR35260.1 (Fe-S)-binding protein [Paracoccus sp. (in: a-proteobacteria)]